MRCNPDEGPTPDCGNTKKVMTEGIWDQYTADKYHQSSPKLAKWLANFLTTEKPVIDFGCGNAFYCKALSQKGFECLGVEGFPLNNFLHDQIAIRDLTKLVDIPTRGHVISLEVGEHLPKAAEQTFLNTLALHCTGILVMSWAEVGQPGIGHINCQSQGYIISEIEFRGFKILPGATSEARKNIDDNTNWFRRTLLVFERI